MEGEVRIAEEEERIAEGEERAVEGEERIVQGEERIVKGERRRREGEMRTREGEKRRTEEKTSLGTDEGLLDETPLDEALGCPTKLGSTGRSLRVPDEILLDRRVYRGRIGDVTARGQTKYRTA